MVLRPVDLKRFYLTVYRRLAAIYDQKILVPLPFEVMGVVHELGMNVRTARKRRRMLQGELAQKAGVGEKTIRRLERGDEGVSIGHALSVLWVLGLLPTAKALASP
jgi:DNA-binding XRE family transcriptional regulator